MAPDHANPKVRADLVHDSFLFTLLATVIHSDIMYVFGIGDGTIAVNGDVVFKGGTGRTEFLCEEFIDGRERTPFKRSLATADLRNVVLATDGADPLWQEPGGLAGFAANDEHFRTPVAIPRLLDRQMATGQLSDDATVVVIRRRPAGTGESNP